jgi:hypothetical protein
MSRPFLKFIVLHLAFGVAIWHLMAGAASPSDKFVPIKDVQLHKGGTLSGNVVDGNSGESIPGTSVLLRPAKSTSLQESIQSVTDENGRFVFENLRGGVYVLATGESSDVVRLWTQGTAPPSAADQVLMVCGPVQRANLGHWLDTPLGTVLVAGGVVSAAIAVPVSLAAQDDTEIIRYVVLPPASP